MQEVYNSRRQEAIKDGVRRAQEKARKEGLNLGDVVAHPDDPLTYCLTGIKGDTATLYLPGEYTEDGQAVVKHYPVDELFDPNVAKDEAFLTYAVSILMNAKNN